MEEGLALILNDMIDSALAILEVPPIRMIGTPFAEYITTQNG
jgi:hypothetical protein